MHKMIIWLLFLLGLPGKLLAMELNNNPEYGEYTDEEIYYQQKGKKLKSNGANDRNFRPIDISKIPGVSAVNQPQGSNLRTIPKSNLPQVTNDRQTWLNSLFVDINVVFNPDKEFFGLPLKDVVHVFSNDNFATASEDDVLMAALLWFINNQNSSIVKNIDSLRCLLSTIRPGYLSKHYKEHFQQKIIPYLKRLTRQKDNQVIENLVKDIFYSAMNKSPRPKSKLQGYGQVLMTRAITLENTYGEDKIFESAPSRLGPYNIFLTFRILMSKPKSLGVYVYCRCPITHEIVNVALKIQLGSVSSGQEFTPYPNILERNENGGEGLECTRPAVGDVFMSARIFI